MAEVLAPNNANTVAIIGGGLAGLSAATKLAEQGISVTLFEAAPQLGGRARRVLWKNTVLDNGQHILLGAYHQTLQLLRSLKVDEASVLMRMPLTLNLHQHLRLNACHLPAPLHLLVGLFCAEGLTWTEKWTAVRFFTHLKFKQFKLKQDLPLADFLSVHHQPKKLIQCLWEPLCLAALNTPLHQASAQVFLNVLRDSFNHKKNDSDLLLPKVDLSTLFADEIATHIKSKVGEIKLNHTIKKIEPQQNSVQLIDDVGETFRFSHVVIATSPSMASQLGLTLNLPDFAYQPIYTVYLQYPAETQLPRIMTGLCNRLSQWVFDRGQLCGQAGLVAVIISAEGQHQKLSQAQLAEQVIAEMKAVFPHLSQPLWHKVIAEKRATFSCTPNLQRPQMHTAWPNVRLAGDYVASDYPATIEATIQSGINCAQHIAAQIHANS